MAGNQFRFSLPQVCCSCLGSADLLHEVSSFSGEGGKSIERKFQVPMCSRCRSTMRVRELITYAVVVGLLVVSGLFLSPYAPVSAEVRAALKVPAAVILGLSFLGFFMIAIGRPFEPARYAGEGVRFRNSRYQELFDQANAPS